MEYWTSDTHPLRIDVLETDLFSGKIGMSICPGKQGQGNHCYWNRNLTKDLMVVKKWNASLFVTLMEPFELEKYKIKDIGIEVTNMGIKWLHLPIIDGYIPDIKFKPKWCEYVEEIKSNLDNSKNIFIHCLGGLGRTGLISAIILQEYNISPIQSIKLVRLARENTIETNIQEEYVLNNKKC